MKYKISALLLMATLVMAISCNTEKKENKFIVKGIVKNSKAEMVVLEEIIPTTLMPLALDSSIIGIDGSFFLETNFGPEKIYTLRFTNGIFPFASLINDASPIIINADFSHTEDLYSVEGSALSQTIKEISSAYPKKWKNLYALRRVYDSLGKVKGPDSLVKKIYDQGDSAFADLKNGIYSYLNASSSAAFSWYLLRNFQQIFTVEEYSAELEKAEKKFEGNEMLKAARDRLNQQIADAIEKQKKENEKSNPAKPNP